MILHRHPDFRRLACNIHPGQPEQRTKRGRVTAPAIAAHAALTIGGRLTIDNLADFDALIGALVDQRQALAEVLARGDGTFGLEVG